MLILGAVAALYLVMLLFRLTISAAPIALGLLMAGRLLADGWHIHGAAALGSAVGLSVYIAGRTLVTGEFPLLIRLPVLITFSGAAACAGFQAGSELGNLGALEPEAQRCLALVTALIAAAACWRHMVRGRPEPICAGGHPGEPAHIIDP